MSFFLLSLVNSIVLTCPQNGNALEQIESEVSQIVEQARPAVVRVNVKRNLPTTDTYQPKSQSLLTAPRANSAQAEPTTLARAFQWRVTTQAYGNRIGSGFCIGDGYVLTTHTVADGGTEVTVNGSDGKERKGSIVGSDAMTDVALIKLQDSDLPTVKLGDSSKSKPGSFGIFLSHSYGSLDNINLGLITGRDEFNLDSPMLRLNFAILPGESGGPLFNSKGEVIGIASANLRRSVARLLDPSQQTENDQVVTFDLGPAYSGMVAGDSSNESSYFIPVDRVKGVIEELKKYGEVRRAWFGVSSYTLVGDSTGLRGVYIKSVQEGSPAQKAEIAPGDIILKCDGKEMPSFEVLRRTIQKLPIGQPVEVVIRRGQQDLTKQVIPELLPGSLQKVGSGKLLGITLVPKSKELAEFLSLQDSPDGKVVSAIQEGGLAAKAGIRKGDLVLDDLKPGKTVRIWRAGKTIEITIPEN